MGVKKLEVELTEECGKDQVLFGHREAAELLTWLLLHGSISKSGVRVTNFIPMHILEPLPKGTRYFSRLPAESDSHLSGLKCSGLGKMASLRWQFQMFMDIGV